MACLLGKLKEQQGISNYELNCTGISTKVINHVYAFPIENIGMFFSKVFQKVELKKLPG